MNSHPETAFWLALAQDRDGEVVTEADGVRQRFWLDPAGPAVSQDSAWMLGFGGQSWIIRFTDGREVATNNLMGNGPIPAEFHHLFPVNAVLERVPEKDQEARARQGVGEPSRAAQQQPHLGQLRGLAAEYITGCAADPEGWPGLLDAVGANLRLGFVGAVLAAAQQPGAGVVATYEEWKSAGWQVRKGEKAHIWVVTGAVGDQQPVAVFTRGQVRPARAATDPPLPGSARVTAGNHDRAAGALTALARRRGYAVTRPEDPSGARPGTDWKQQRIVLPASLPSPQAVAALAHELGHITIGGGHPHPAGAMTAGCHGAAAAEADSVGWLVLARLGLDPAAAGITFPAAQVWAGPDPRSPLAGVITAVGERVTSAATEIAAHAEKVLAVIPAAPAAVALPVVPVATRGSGAESRPRRALTVTDRLAWPVPDQELVRVNAAAAAFFRARLPGSWAESYLAGRGFGPAISRRWHLGYAPAKWTGLLDHLRRGGYPDARIEAAGLAHRSRRGTLIDFFRDRVMIPVRGHHGQVIAFAGRAPDDSPDGTPKYLNTPQTEIYSKDQVLYGLAEAGAALGQGARPVLVEGYFDVIAVTESGHLRLAGIAPGGTALSDRQMAALAGACDLGRTPLLVARDPDAGGRKATVRDYQIITPYSPAAGTPELPDGRDPANIFTRGGPEALAAALAKGEHPLADVAVDAVLGRWAGRLQWVEGQLGAVREAASLFAQVPAANLARQIFRVAERTGIPHADVAGEFATVIAAEPAPKDSGSADGNPDPGKGDSAATRDFPAPPSPGRRRISRRSAPARPPPGRPSCRR
jgi:DNA primase